MYVRRRKGAKKVRFISGIKSNSGQLGIKRAAGEEEGVDKENGRWKGRPFVTFLWAHFLRTVKHQEGVVKETKNKNRRLDRRVSASTVRVNNPSGESGFSVHISKSFQGTHSVNRCPTVFQNSHGHEISNLFRPLSVPKDLG